MGVRELRRDLRETFGKLNTVYLATVKGNQPWLRPVTLIHQNLNFWIVTGAKDKKSGHIAHNPRIAFVLPLKKGKYTGYIRATARARRVRSKAEMKKVARLCGFVDHYFKKGIDDPNLAIFRMTPTKMLRIKPRTMQEEDVTSAVKK